jgi:hypothetical protein
MLQLDHCDLFSESPHSTTPDPLSVRGKAPPPGLEMPPGKHGKLSLNLAILTLLTSFVNNKIIGNIIRPRDAAWEEKYSVL